MAITKVQNKAVVKLGLTDSKSKKAVKKALMELDGFSSYTLDFEKSTLVLMGDIDPTAIVVKLRKFVSADLVTFGPAKDKGMPPRNDGGGGGNGDQQPVNPPPNHGAGPSGYGYDYIYYPYYSQP